MTSRWRWKPISHGCLSFLSLYYLIIYLIILTLNWSQRPPSAIAVCYFLSKEMCFSCEAEGNHSEKINQQLHILARWVHLGPDSASLLALKELIWVIQLPTTGYLFEYKSQNKLIIVHLYSCFRKDRILANSRYFFTLNRPS